MEPDEAADEAGEDVDQAKSEESEVKEESVAEGEKEEKKD